MARRSLERISDDDLARLSRIAAGDLADYARRSATAALYARRVLCTALCQGAALHFVDGKTGVKDFDVWTFFAAVPDRPFPPRRRAARDFGPSRFGRTPSAPRDFAGPRVDLLGRSLDERLDADPVEAVVRYLSARRTTSARRLAEKAVVILDPVRLRGTVAWPPTPKGSGSARVESRPCATESSAIRKSRSRRSRSDRG